MRCRHMLKMYQITANVRHISIGHTTRSLMLNSDKQDSVNSKPVKIHGVQLGRLLLLDSLQRDAHSPQL